MNPEDLLLYINDSENGLSAKLSDLSKKRKRKPIEKKYNLSEKVTDIEFWDGYTEAVLQFRAAKIHSSGDFPNYLFKVLQPLQEEDELAYLRDTYQPITKDVFLEFSNTAKTGIRNGHIEFPASNEEDGNDLERYLLEDIKNFNSLTLWAQAMLDQKLVDANGIFAVWPNYEMNENYEIVGDTSPQPYVYNVDRIVWKHDGEYIVLTSKKTAAGGMVLRYFGREYVAQYDQVGDLKDFQFAITRRFEHGISFCPAQELKGLAIINDEDVHYESIFNIAVSHLNLAVIDSVTLLAIKKKVGYPTRVVIREKCNFTDGAGGICEGGFIKTSDGEKMVKKTCKNCRGSGFIGVFGPMSELSINAGNSLDDTGKVTASNAMAYVSPPTDIPKFLREEVEHHLARSKEVLHLRSEPRGSGDISATEKNRDKENTEAFIKPISDQTWDIIAYIIECIGVMRYGKESYDKMKPKIIPAQSFDLLGPDDYIAEMSEAKESGAPEVVIQNIVYRYMAVINHDDTISMRVFQLIEKSDRLLTLSNDQVAIAQSRGTVAPWEAVLHQSSTYIVYNTLMDYQAGGNKDFWDLPVEEQITMVQDKAKSIVPTSDLGALPAPIEP